MKHISTFLTIGMALILLSASAWGQQIGDYGSAGTNNAWNTASNWVVCVTNGTWAGATTATLAPTATTNVWIRGTHTVTLPASGNPLCKDLNVETNGVLNSANIASSPRYVRVYGNINNSGTIGGTNDGISLNPYGGSCTISGSGTTYFGRFQPQVASTSITINTNVTLVYGASGGSATIYCNGNATTLTVNAGYTLAILPYTGLVGYLSVGTSGSNDPGTGQSLTVNVSGTLTLAEANHFNLRNTSAYTSTLNVYNGGVVNCGGSLWAPSAGAGTANVTVDAGGQLNFAGTTGACDLSKATTTMNGTWDFGNTSTSTRSIGATATVGGRLRYKDGVYSTAGTITLGGTSTVEYYGSSGITLGASPTTYSNLTINNAGGVTLGASPTVNGTLTFTAGKITTGANTLTIGETGTVGGGGGGRYVYGNLARAIPATGSPTIGFDIGDATKYTPVSVDFNSLTAAGTITASTTGVEHANIGTSTIDPLKSVNRNWTLSNTTAAFTDYAATFTFDPTDVDGGANTSNFIVGKYNSGWTYPAVGSKTSTSTQATALTSFSSFALGELAPLASDAPVLNSPIAEGATSVSGTSTEADGTTITVYVNGSSVGTTTVASNAWTMSGMTALVAGELVKATATASGEAESPFSNVVTVQAYTAAPAVSSPIGEGATSVSGTSTEADGTTIDVYVDGSSVGTTTVASNAWTKTGLTALTAGQQVKAKATASGKLESGFSSIVTVEQVTAVPVVSSPIAEGATSVSGTSTEADGTIIDVYVDGSSVGTTTVASNAWTMSGMTALNAGQQVKAKATASGKLESGFSSTVTVQAYTSAPIVGSPISQGATAVSGTSTEADGTTIDVYVDGSSVGTTTVSSNAWTKSGLTALTVGQEVKAKATAPGKLESGFSNIVTVTAGLGITTASPLPNATAGAAYTQTLTASGGTAPYGNWQVISGSLPPSMNLNSSTGELSGTSTVAGTYSFTVEVTDAAPTTVNKAFSLTVDPGSLHHFAIGTILTPQIAGTAFGITLTAQDVNNNTVTGFTGTVGLSTTAGTIAPTTSGSFVLGVRNENVTITQAGTGKTIGVDDGSGHTATSNTFDVDPGTLDHFAIGSISTPQVAGTAFGITITAQDLNNNTVTGFAGTVGLTTTAGTISPTTTGSFVLGVRIEDVTVTLAGTGRTISVDDGSGNTAISNTFDVNPGSVDHFAIGTITSPQIAGTPFNLVMTAQDLNNNIATAFTGTVAISLSSGTIAPTTSASFVAGVRTEPVTVSTGGTGLTISVNDGSAHTGTSNSFDVTVPTPYRSAVAAFGNWNAAGSWEIFDGTTWVPATGTPTSSDGAITILNGDTIVVTAPVTADQVTVDAGGALTVAASQTLTVANAADSVDMVVFGTVNNIGTITATGRISFENGGVYKHNTASATTAAASTTWRTGSTFEINNGSAPGNLNQHALYNLVVNPGTTMGGNGGPNFPNNYVLSGSLTVTSTNGFQWRLANLSAGLTTNIFIRGNVNVNGSTVLLTSTGSSADTAAKAVINVDGSVNITAGQWSLNNSSAAYAEWKVKGNISVTGGTLQSGTSGWYGRRTLNFAGGGTQSFTVSAPGTIGTAATTFKVSNGSTVQMNFPFTLMTNGAINLENGKFATTATNVITLPATGTVIGGNSSAYVDGPLVQTVASTNATTKTFPIGKGSAYRPVTLTVNQDAATATPYTAEVFNTAPVSRTLPSTLSGVSSVRYFSIIKGAGAGLSPTLGATIQLSYDVDDGVESASLLRVAKDSGSTYWANLGGSGTGIPSGSITSNAFFSFSDFVLATADTTTPAVLPTVATTAMSYISTTTALSGGNVTNDGGAAVSARGVCWNTTGAPTVSDNKTIDGTGAGPFMSSLTGLTPGVTYYLRAYATNTAGSGYGNELTFSTLTSLVPPAVTTTALSQIQVTTAVSGGTVTDWGGDSVTVRGICWNTSGSPTIGGSHTVDGAGLGSFVSGLHPLTGGTLYYVRAYATNSAGTGYGNELSFTTQTPQPDVTKVVAQDGSGDYLTVQAAFNAVPANYTGKWTIFVKNGVYYEKLLLASTKINVILVGQNKDSTILTYDDYADRYGSGNPGTSGSYSVAIDASDFMARNITFQNTYSPQPGVSGTQAVALRTQGDRHQFINCRILGYQDTYYTWGGSGTGRTYHKDCFIEGTVDFIFGRNIVVFDNCTIHEIRNGATITAGATDVSSLYGYVFRNCSIITDPIGYDGVPITTSYLGRPWQGSPRTVFINSYEPSSLVPAGWQSWNVTPGLYAEYNCYGPGSATGGRVAWSSQLSGPVAATYSLSNIFARSSASSSLILYDWMPDSAATNLPLAIRLTSSAGANGSITPSGATNIIYGGSQTYTITPDANHHVADVLVDGVSVGAVTSHTIAGATSNHSISATFAIDTYTITATTGGNGSITPSGSVVVNYGADQQFTFTPDPGYHVDSVFVDGGYVDSTSSYTFVNVTANHSISSTFLVNPPNQFTLTITAVNGTVTRNPNAPTYDSASTVHMTANPAVGYHFVNWTDDLTSSSNPDSIIMNSNKSVTANFAINTYTLDVTATNGTVVLNPPTGPYNHGTVVTLTATPAPGYHFGGWTGSLTGSNNPDSIVMDGNKSVTATFIVNPTIVQSNGTGGGLWSSVGTWQGGIVPSDLDTAIIIGSDSVVVGVTDSCLRVSVQSGAKLALVDTLKVGTVGVSGRLINFKVLAASGAVVFDSGSVYQHAQINGSIPVATWNSGSTCMVTGYVSGSKPNNSNQNFYNFTWNCPGQNATVDIAWFNNTIYGDINVPSTGTGRLQLTSPSAGTPNTITILGNISFASGNFTSNGSSSAATITIEDHGNITVTGGNFSATRGSGPVVSWNLYGNMVMSNATTQNSNSGSRFVFKKTGTQTLALSNMVFAGGGLPVEVNNGTTLDAGISTIRGSGAFTLNAGATVKYANPGGIDSLLAGTGTKTLNVGANYIFNGSVAQVTGVLMPGAVNNLTIDNTAGVALTDTVQINGTLAFVNGKLSTGVNLAIVGASGSVSGADQDKYVYGRLMKTVPVSGGAGSQTYEIGDASAYTPVLVAGSSYSSPFDILATSTGVEHPGIYGSGIDSTKSVNRYYTLSGIPTGPSEITFNFVEGDVDAAANANNFIIGKFNSPTWTLPSVGTRTVTSTQAVGVASFSDFVIGESLPQNATVGVPVALSWNIVSLPVSAPTPDDSVQHIYANSINTFGFAFVGGYVQRSTMTNGPGYWIKSSAAYTQNITGSPRDTLTVPVAAAWNMIGSITTSIDTSAASVTPTPADLRGSNFFKYDNGYVVATTIEPGSGYWVRANSVGSFFMHATGPAAKRSTGELTVGRSIEDLNTLTIQDANGGSQTLYFGTDAGGEIPVSMFAMPPAPPEGSFDARFASSEGGLMVQTHAEQIENVIDLPIMVQSSAYPLTVSWKVNLPAGKAGGTASSYELSDGSTTHPVRGEGSLRITNSRVQQLLLKVTGEGGLPKEFALSQNYPNPFNPTTNIKYALPVESRLTMEVYNMLGQRVRTLIDDNVAAGYHIAEWNGTGSEGQQLGSGTYFLKLSAAGINGTKYSEVRKILMLK
jgi:uncharacterized repeat protein (TIGR02543 family)